MEGADNLGVTNDGDLSGDSQSTTSHLTTELDAAGVTWKTYEEDIDGTSCPLVDTNHYLVRDDPFVYLEQVGELAVVDRACSPATDMSTRDPRSRAPGDTELSQEVPKILASNAMKRGAHVLIWDHPNNADDAT